MPTSSREDFVNGLLNHFKSALGHYREGKWDDATAAFNEVLGLNSEDRLSQIYIDRCEQLKASPPPDWKGIWVMESK